MTAQRCQLRTASIRKEYPGTVALDDVSVTFEGGQVHALLGKNGAGKSTLVKILAGATAPTRGQILLNGKPVELRSPQDAFDQGIATVYQELSLVPELTVGENILLGRLPKRKGTAGLVIDWPETYRRAQAVLDDMQVQIDVRERVSRLSVAQQQVVEIAKGMSFRPSVIMLDEPTSALAQHETESLFRLVKQLAAKGVAIIYITHRLQELHQIADVITVLRDGRHIGTVTMQEASPERIIHMLFGALVAKQRRPELVQSAEPVMEVRRLGRKGVFRDVSFTLYEGEVLGIAGMLGSGRTELLRALYGAEPFDQGELQIGGTTVRAPTPDKMKRLGLAFTPENRKEEGLIQLLSIRANMCLAALSHIGRRGFIRRKYEQVFVDRYVQKLSIKVSDTEHAVSALSGGNQQKVIIGNWLATNPRVILFDEPTRGIDVQAKQQIFEIMWDLSRRGISSVFVSSELEELVEVCSRILIMKNHTISDSISPARLSPNDLFVSCMEA